MPYSINDRSIRLNIQDREMVKIDENGAFHVEGRLVVTDKEVYDGFVRFLVDNGMMSAIRDIDALKAKVTSLYDALAHGDDEHKAWLKQKLQDHFGF